MIARLQPLAKPGKPWFGSAGEMTAMALIKQGKKHEAGQMFAAIAKDKSVPDSHPRARRPDRGHARRRRQRRAAAAAANRTDDDQIEVFRGLPC